VLLGLSVGIEQRLVFSWYVHIIRYGASGYNRFKMCYLLTMNLYYPSIFLLLLFGILNPVGGNKIDFFVGYFLFFLTAFYIFLPNNFDKLRRYAIWVVLASFIVSSFATSDDLRGMLGRDLPLYTYNNDPGVMLETYQLMENGTGYYDAFAFSQKGRFGMQIVPADIWGWRLPTLFEIWKVLPGKSGLNIYLLYLVLACSFFYCSYLLSRRYLPEKLATIPSYLVFPYLHFAARDQMLLETEWWSVIVFFIAVFFTIRRRFVLATLLFSLTVMIREVYILPLGLMFIYSIMKRRDLIPVFLIPLFAFWVIFLFHIGFVSRYIDVWGTIFSPRVIANGFFFVQQTLAFASWEYLLFAFRPFWWFLVAALAGCWLIYKRFDKTEAWLLLLSFLPFPIAFLKFGTVPYNDYWGIMYMPIVLVLAPIALGNLTKQSTKA